MEVQKQEHKALAEPKTLVGAIKALNEINDGRQNTGAQQRLRTKEAPVCDRSNSSVRIVGKKKADPERERRGKPVVKTPPLVDHVVAKPSVAAPRQAATLQAAVVQAADVSVSRVEDDSDSDDPDKDRIIMQRLKVKLETERLPKYESEYAIKKEMKRRKR